MERLDNNKIEMAHRSEEMEEYLGSIKNKLLAQESEPSDQSWDKISFEITKSNKAYHFKRYLKYVLYSLGVAAAVYAFFIWNSNSEESSITPLPVNKEVEVEKETLQDIMDNTEGGFVISESQKESNKEEYKPTVKENINSINSPDNNRTVLDTIVHMNSDNSIQDQNMDTLSSNPAQDLSKVKKKTVLNDSTIDYRQLFKKKDSR